MTTDQILLLAAARLMSAHPEELLTVLDKVGGAGPLFASSDTVLAHRLNGINPALAATKRRLARQEAEDEVPFLEKNGVKTLIVGQPDYPELLGECADAPTSLFVLGDAELLCGSRPRIAIVGTRHATAYGTEMATRIVTQLAEQLTVPPVIVSGLAYGIDVAAHRAAINCGCPTVAVLGHGLSTIYPAQHRKVAAKIAMEGGALVTEYMSQERIHRANFLARNRIVAGLCDCTIVVESDVRGGSLATARLAMEYNRDVFAVPGRVTDRYSLGCNNLIASNRAAIFSDTESLIADMRWPVKDAKPTQPELFRTLPPEQQQVVDMLRAEPSLTTAHLTDRLGLKPQHLAALIADMEFDGVLLQTPGGHFTLL